MNTKTFKEEFMNISEHFFDGVVVPKFQIESGFYKLSFLGYSLSVKIDLDLKEASEEWLFSKACKILNYIINSAHSQINLNEKEKSEFYNNMMKNREKNEKFSNDVKEKTQNILLRIEQNKNNSTQEKYDNSGTDIENLFGIDNELSKYPNNEIPPESLSWINISNDVNLSGHFFNPINLSEIYPNLSSCSAISDQKHIQDNLFFDQLEDYKNIKNNSYNSSAMEHPDLNEFLKIGDSYISDQIPQDTTEIEENNRNLIIDDFMEKQRIPFIGKESHVHKDTKSKKNSENSLKKQKKNKVIQNPCDENLKKSPKILNSAINDPEKLQSVKIPDIKEFISAYNNTIKNGNCYSNLIKYFCSYYKVTGPEYEIVRENDVFRCTALFSDIKFVSSYEYDKIVAKENACQKIVNFIMASWDKIFENEYKERFRLGLNN